MPMTDAILIYLILWWKRLRYHTSNTYSLISVSQGIMNIENEESFQKGAQGLRAMRILKIMYFYLMKRMTTYKTVLQKLKYFLHIETKLRSIVKYSNKNVFSSFT